MRKLGYATIKKKKKRRKEDKTLKMMWPVVFLFARRETVNKSHSELWKGGRGRPALTVTLLPLPTPWGLRPPRSPAGARSEHRPVMRNGALCRQVSELPRQEDSEVPTVTDDEVRQLPRPGPPVHC